jgi:hypothetical protein
MPPRLHQICSGTSGLDPAEEEARRQNWSTNPGGQTAADCDDYSALPVQQAARGRCKYLGEPTGAELPCPPCGGGVRIKVFGCALHGQCTVAKAQPQHACCAQCNDHRAA